MLNLKLMIVNKKKWIKEAIIIHSKIVHGKDSHRSKYMARCRQTNDKCMAKNLSSIGYFIVCKKKCPKHNYTKLVNRFLYR